MYPSGSRCSPLPQRGVGRQAQAAQAAQAGQAGLGQSAARFKLAGKYGPERTSPPLLPGPCGCPGGSGGHRGQVGCGDVPGTSLLVEDHGFPSRIPPASADVDGSPQGGHSAQTTHRWGLWVPWHPVDGGAEPVLTPTQGPTSPRGCVWEPVVGGREEPQLWGPQKCPSSSPPPLPPFLGSHPNSGCCSPRLRARRRGYLHRSTHGPGQGVTGASPDQQNSSRVC